MINISPICRRLPLKHICSKTMLEHPRKRGKSLYESSHVSDIECNNISDCVWGFVTSVEKLYRKQESAKFRTVCGFASIVTLWKMCWIWITFNRMQMIWANLSAFVDREILLVKSSDPILELVRIQGPKGPKKYVWFSCEETSRGNLYGLFIHFSEYLMVVASKDGKTIAFCHFCLWISLLSQKYLTQTLTLHINRLSSQLRFVG